MKKRSLVAAVAMLIVSAIVLTSSTYAWFATGNTATVAGLSASVGNDSSSISISANGTTFLPTLSSADILAANANAIPTALIPVSLSYADNSVSFITGAIAQNETDDAILGGKMIFTAAQANDNTGKYMKFNVHVRASADCTVNVTANMGSAVYDFVYAAITDGTNIKYFNLTTGRSYTPVNSVVDGIDVNNDGIMQADVDKLMNGSSSYNALGSSITAANEALSLSFVTETGATSPADKQLTVYVWAEGNDEHCAGPISSATSAVSLNFAKV